LFDDARTGISQPVPGPVPEIEDATAVVSMLCEHVFSLPGIKPGTIGQDERFAEKRETRKSFDQLDLSFCGEVAERLKAAVC
jgi:hypothetical protein